MKHDVAIKWVEALRDPNARQAKGVLEDASGARCCLGALCRVLDIPAAPARKLFDNGAKVDCVRFGSGPGGSYEILPEEARDLAGMSGRHGVLTNCNMINLPNGNFPTLAEANDRGATFAQIADWIEQNWEKL